VAATPPSQDVAATPSSRDTSPVPHGTTENSPAIYRGDIRKQIRQSPVRGERNNSTRIGGLSLLKLCATCATNPRRSWTGVAKRFATSLLGEDGSSDTAFRAEAHTQIPTASARAKAAWRFASRRSPRHGRLNHDSRIREASWSAPALWRFSHEPKLAPESLTTFVGKPRAMDCGGKAPCPSSPGEDGSGDTAFARMATKRTAVSCLPHKNREAVPPSLRLCATPRRFQPVRAKENSPPIHRWVPDLKPSRVPSGTKEIPPSPTHT